MSATQTPGDRAADLLDRRRETGRPLDFAFLFGTIHVAYGASLTVCGQRLRGRTRPMPGFDENRLCPRCRATFADTGAAGLLAIREDNQP